MCTFGLSSCHVKPRRPTRRPPGLAHDSPRTPNAHISGPRRFKHHQNSTKEPQERERRKKIVAGRGKKKREILPPFDPSRPHLRGPTFSSFWPPPFGRPTLRGPTLCRPKIQHPKLAEVEIGRSRNWPKSKLAEVELAKLEKKSWPKSNCRSRSRLVKTCRLECMLFQEKFLVC